VAQVRRVLIFTLITVLILTIGSWVTSTAYGQVNDATGLNATANGEITVTPAPAETQPVLDIFGNYIGGVGAGDLFYVNATSSEPDISVYLYITNTDELAQSFRYLILKVGMYVEDGNGQWQKITSQGGVALPDRYITLENGMVNFTLSGLAHYKITIESGSYKSYPRSNGAEISPQFYLSADLV
jgi:hypothetical protein